MDTLCITTAFNAEVNFLALIRFLREICVCIVKQFYSIDNCYIPVLDACVIQSIRMIYYDNEE